MLPGQGYEVSRNSAAGSTPSMSFFSRTLNLRMKCITNSGMSLARSRSEGSRIGTTFKR